MRLNEDSIAYFVYDMRMKTPKNEKDLIYPEQVAQFLDGTQAVAFIALSDKDDNADSLRLIECFCMSKNLCHP